MITITQLSISNDLTTMQLDVAVSVGQVVTEILLWNQDTFKDANQAVDLSSMIAGADETESLSLVPSDISESDFSGLYILQITSDDGADNPAMVAAISLRQYYSVVAALLTIINTDCLNCNNNLQNAILLDMYLEGIKTALQVGRFRDAITFLEKINITTAGVDCDSCFNQTIPDPGDGWVTVGVLDCILGLDPLI